MLEEEIIGWLVPGRTVYVLYLYRSEEQSVDPFEIRK